MEKNTKVKESCCACEENFENKIHDLEKEATAPTTAEHDKKRRELDSAFKDEKKSGK